MESTLNTHFDGQRAQLIAIAADNSQLDTQISITDNRWSGYDFAIDRDGTDVKNGVRIVNVDGAIMIHTFTGYLLAGTFTITGSTTGTLINTIIKTQLDFVAAVSA